MAETPTRIAKADFQREIVKMATEDKAFRKKLLANPKEALKSAIGFEPPQGVDVQVLEEQPTRMYLVLPPEASAFKGGRELGDEDLKAVAGGAGGGLTRQMQGFAGGSFLQRFGNEKLPGGIQTPGAKNAVVVIWG